MKTPRLLHGSLRMLICLCLPAASLFAQTGSLAGSVTDEGNKSIAGAFVIANRETLPAASGRATSAADGTFQVSGLPAGSYTICVQVAGGGFLDTCEWTTTPLTVGVKTGQALGGLQVKMKKGALLQVRLNDPSKLLEPLAAAVVKTVPHVLMAVQTPRGLLHPLTQTSKDLTGATHTATVPFDAALKFRIFSPHVSLADEKGGALGPAGSTASLTLSSGAIPLPLTFTVTGPK